MGFGFPLKLNHPKEDAPLLFFLWKSSGHLRVQGAPYIYASRGSTFNERVFLIHLSCKGGQHVWRGPPCFSLSDLASLGARTRIAICLLFLLFFSGLIPFPFFSAIVLFKNRSPFPTKTGWIRFSRKLRIPGFRMEMEAPPWRILAARLRGGLLAGDAPAGGLGSACPNVPGPFSRGHPRFAWFASEALGSDPWIASSFPRGLDISFVI